VDMTHLQALESPLHLPYFIHVCRHLGEIVLHVDLFDHQL
jgi:hypothetical protein